MTSSSDNTASARKSSKSKSNCDPIKNLLNLLLESNEVFPEKANLESKSDSKIPQYPDLDVDIETEADENTTLIQAVQYQAFLRQTVELDEISASSTDKTKLNSIETDTAHSSIQKSTRSDLQTEYLVDSVNTLIPLIVELLKYKIHDSQEAILTTVAPVLDRLIEQRSLEDSPKMASAIAKILPNAITEEMNLSPEAIAKAIAPELAIAISEQIRLDENAISLALGSEMGKAIKTQIELEKDAMVDALYPVIGSTISKYMVEVVREINSKVEHTLSPEGIKRKIRAKIQGVSEAELIFQESVKYHVQAIFLIDKDSGLIIQEVQPEGERHLESDMIAGMLTAIRSFANDCITSGSELDEINYGDWQIPIEVAGYCYVAVVVKGEPSNQFRTKIRQILGQIVLKYGNTIKKYEGDPDTVPKPIKSLLEELIEKEDSQPKKSSSPPMLLWLAAILLGMVFIPWGIIHHRGNTAQKIEQEIATQLDAAPELSVYRLDSQVRRGKLTLTGRVPSEYLRTQAATVAQEVASQKNLQLDNQIIAVNVPINPSLITGEIQRLTSLFNQLADTAIITNYQPKTLTIDGFILNEENRQSIYTAFKKIPGVEQIIINVAKQLPNIEQRIYFESGSSKLNFADNSSRIKVVEQLLKQYPQIHLRLIAHTDGEGSRAINQKLRKERCENVRVALIDQGVDSTRLVTSCNQQNFSTNPDKQPLWLSRYVNFQLFIPTNQHN
jgi:outer membrane protein OmpA-like peptidoglycan-associated protein